MAWLNYTDDEVTCFHREFVQLADLALQAEGLSSNYEWVHHFRTPANTLIPDYVLREISSQRWVVAIEIKRTKEAVYSPRFQLQAKGYAEHNRDLYFNRPKFFAITNLEVTILFALNGDRPPDECRLKDGTFRSGELGVTDEQTHKSTFVEQIRNILRTVLSTAIPTFDTVWPGILSSFSVISSEIPFIPEIGLEEPNSDNWVLVRNYFASSLKESSKRIFIFRCLMAEYLRGVLLKFNHKDAQRISPLNPRKPTTSVATAIDILQTIDFQSIFSSAIAQIYRNLNNRELINALSSYIQAITSGNQNVRNLVLERVDSSELLDSLMNTIYPIVHQDEQGKVSTDPELAALLSYVTITDLVDDVLDPCCGDGSLISAAYDRLEKFNLGSHDIISRLSGVEVDPLSAILAFLKIVLKQPSTITPQPQVDIVQGDMFVMINALEKADVVLMNPPFKRYEAQDRNPIPLALRQHFAQAIRSIDNQPSVTTDGQANIYNYYVEFVGKVIKEGAKVGLILDNKWYHSKYGTGLRGFMLENFEVEAIIDYPHDIFFSSFTIATSIVVLRKTSNPNVDHQVKFIRVKSDPRYVDLPAINNAMKGAGEFPPDWSLQSVLQSDLSEEEGWKIYFSKELEYDFRTKSWPTLDDLFEFSRRGSLNKEEGGIGVLEFPFNRTNFGSQRLPIAGRRRRYQTKTGRPLTAEENQALYDLAENIPTDFRGYAIKNADDIDHFELSIEDVQKQQTIEPPLLRSLPELFREERRSDWTNHHTQSVQDMRHDPAMEQFINGIETIVNLNNTVLSDEELWNVLREPFAGELIIPRKTRLGHRVHINQFAFNPDGRQARLSSNFISYYRCNAIDPGSGLDAYTAVRLIAAFLLSSFGQLQFEMEGYNREGLLALEKAQLSRIKIFDPRWIRVQNRQRILDILDSLPYPVASVVSSSSLLTERRKLDEIFAAEIEEKHPDLLAKVMLDEVTFALDEWILAREP